MPRNAYYDIETILAEEELVPCTTLLEFRHLAHLDPDFVEHGPNPMDGPNEDYSADAQKLAKSEGKAPGKRKKRGRGPPRHLPETSKIKMPIWSVEKWAGLGFVRVGLPRHFGRKARERLEADPSVADLRKKNERFFMSGNLLVDLVERCSKVLLASSARGRRGVRDAAAAQVAREAAELRRTLIVTYSGDRMRRILDWTLSSIDDDVTNFTRRLTCLEMILFREGAAAASAHASWKANGSRRIAVSGTALRSAALGRRADQTAAATADRDAARAVTPDQDGGRNGGGRRAGRKRTRGSY